MSKCHAARFITCAAISVAACLPSQQSFAATALRVQTDLERGRRWELDWGFASVYDLNNGQLIRSIPLPGAILSGARDTCLPDLLLGPSGELIVSSNATPTLWRISPVDFEIEGLDIEVDADQDKDFGFSGLAWGEDRKIVYAVSATTGLLWRIDLDSARASKIP